ncbi:hypothetical protein H4R33_001730 [Dimargaris cristalligena]|nr:hypothetical protein H4R33_001730 [Dimargaris cristalligena]
MYPSEVEFLRQWPKALGFIQQDQVHALQSLASQLGANLNAFVVHQDKHGDTLAHFAARHHALGCLHWLVDEAGADPNIINQHGRSILHEAVDDLPCLEYLLQFSKRESGQRVYIDINHAKRGGWTVLHTAALKGNASLVSLLLDHGAEPRLRNKDGYTPVHLASQYNQLTALQLMVRAQPSSALLATRNGRLPIHLAARQGGREVVLWFLEAASENRHRDHPTAGGVSDSAGGWSVPAMLEAEDSAGADVLQDAVVSGSVPLLSALLHPETTSPWRDFLLASHRLTRPEHSTGKTILHLACMANHLLVLEYLYQHDMVGDPNVRDTWDGWSPLMYSARYGDVNIIDFLIRRCQANKQLTDRHGRTALDIALMWKRPPAVMDLLGPP